MRLWHGEKTAALIILQVVNNKFIAINYTQSAPNPLSHTARQVRRLLKLGLDITVYIMYIQNNSGERL